MKKKNKPTPVKSRDLNLSQVVKKKKIGNRKIAFYFLIEIDFPLRYTKDIEMLKVVGASWAQTQLSWCLIITITFLGLLAFYFGGTIR